MNTELINPTELNKELDALRMTAQELQSEVGMLNTRIELQRDEIKKLKLEVARLNAEVFSEIFTTPVG